MVVKAVNDLTVKNEMAWEGKWEELLYIDLRT